MSADADVNIYWKDPALLLLASQLMHQQLYLIGRDIESRHGNLLIQYGFKKTCAPDGRAVSLYSMRFIGGYHLALRGFGVFVGKARLGGLFLRRYELEPRWMPSARFVPIVWLPQEMPRTRMVRKDEQYSAIQLATQVFQFFHTYERWIRDTYGKRYRAAQLVSFRRLGNHSVHWNTISAWDSLC